MLIEYETTRNNLSVEPQTKTAMFRTREGRAM